MPRKRTQYSAEYKFRVALEAAKGDRTLNEVAGAHGLHPNQISQWKRQLLSSGASVFGQSVKAAQVAQAGQEAQLFEQIGRLKMELEWLKKKGSAFD